MLQIDNKIISLDVIEQKFLCDISQCMGECCVGGDAGAPLEEGEIEILEGILPVIRHDLPEKSRKVIEKQGVSYIDAEGEPVTSIVGNGECVFAYFDEGGTCKCAIEKAYREGKTDFYKPVSCHLYPVRVAKYRNFIAVNYHQWEVCEAARTLGKAHGVAVYQFLKEPLIRKFGAEWYAQLVIAAQEFSRQNRAAR